MNKKGDLNLELLMKIAFIVVLSVILLIALRYLINFLTS